MTLVEQKYTYAVGRRKSAVAQVRLFPDAGPVVVDDKLIEEAFPYSTWQQVINEPFTVTNTQGRFRVVAKVKGGGVNGRAGAIRHGIARALSQVENGRYRLDLKKAGLSKVVIERSSKKVRVSIHASRPGVIIGKKGVDIEKLKKDDLELNNNIDTLKNKILYNKENEV